MTGSCPRCGRPLAAPPRTETGAAAGCRRCGGSFVLPGQVADLLGRHADPVHWRHADGMRARGRSELLCPTDGEALFAFEARHGRSRVVVDVCFECRGLWLDKGEGRRLRRILAQHRGPPADLAPPGVLSYFFQLFTGLPIEEWNPVRRRPVAIYGLLAVLLGAFLIQLATATGESLEGPLAGLALVPAAVRQGDQLLGLLGHVLLHGGLLHLATNLYFLYVFGDNLEDVLGPARLIGIFLASALGGALAHVALDSHPEIPAVGASGGVSGLMGAYAVLFPRVRLWIVVFFIRFRIGVIAWLAIWAGIQLLMGLGEQPFVAWYAHLGGLATGALAGLVLRRHAGLA